MQYTQSDILLFIAAIGVVLVNIVTAWRNSDKLVQIGETAKVIEGHVNSKEAKYTEQIASLQRERDLLMNIIAGKDQDKALLAQAASARSHDESIITALGTTIKVPEVTK